MAEREPSSSSSSGRFKGVRAVGTFSTYQNRGIFIKKKDLRARRGSEDINFRKLSHTTIVGIPTVSLTQNKRVRRSRELTVVVGAE